MAVCFRSARIRGRRRKKWRKIDLPNIIEPIIIITIYSKASEKHFDKQASFERMTTKPHIHFAPKSICFSYEGMDCRYVRLFDKLCVFDLRILYDADCCYALQRELKSKEPRKEIIALGGCSDTNLS